MRGLGKGHLFEKLSFWGVGRTEAPESPLRQGHPGPQGPWSARGDRAAGPGASGRSPSPSRGDPCGAFVSQGHQWGPAPHRIPPEGPGRAGKVPTCPEALLAAGSGEFGPDVETDEERVVKTHII